jgi:hypothetical protein
MLYQQRVRKFKWLSAKFPNVSLVTPVGVLKKHAYASYMRFATTFCPALWASNFTALSASSRRVRSFDVDSGMPVAKNLSRITVITARASNAP